MSEYGHISATVRTKTGKGVARQLRQKGLIPAVMYGQGGANVPLTIDPHAFRKATDPARNLNTFYQITVDDGGTTQVVPCVIADIQTDAVRDNVLHIDFLRVDPELEIERPIPVRYFGRAAGVMIGGRLNTYRRTVRISAKPGQMPVELAIDLTPLEAGQYLRISDMSLPNATFVEPPQAPLAFIETPKAVKAEETVDAKKPAEAKKGGKK